MKSDQNELLVVGIDVGTTGAKALVMSASGEVVGAGYQGYPLITGEGGIVEQDASLWYDASCTAVRQAASDVDTSRIRALSMSTQGASSLLVDEAGSPLGNAITWMDGRAAAEKHEIIAALGDETVYETTGWRTHQALDACKLKWIVKHQKDDYDRAAYYLSTLEYMNARLTGVCAVDPTNAAIRQLMDIQTLAYDDGILDAAGGDAAKLPQILPTGKLLETLTPQAAADLGLHADVRVYNGAHDQYCGLYGAGVSRSGELMLSAGTAWVTVGVTDQPLHTKSYMSPGPYIVPGKYGALASLPCSGAAFDWLRSGVISTDYADINAQAASRRDKCADLLFYPYLSGAAFPLWNENHRGAMLGLSLEHDKYDIALACMEAWCSS